MFCLFSLCIVFKCFCGEKGGGGVEACIIGSESAVQGRGREAKDSLIIRPLGARCEQMLHDMDEPLEKRRRQVA